MTDSDSVNILEFFLYNFDSVLSDFVHIYTTPFLSDNARLKGK